ncbi:NfeD family protein [Saliphagus sp. LR7]|uniref:NfeD family protein n=1 Tax=Saliphagus sp. LR7 TaxID=2282654 RepID=UPI000DF7FB3B|nr:NfeD family protein [Saliphagus sp. LR7]
MVEFLVENLPLALLGAGLVLMVLEAVSPGAHLIVVGVALVGAGLIGVLFPPIAGPLVMAALTLLFGAAATWIYREFDFYGGKGTAQTSDSDSLSGRTGYVTERVTNRSGEVKLEEGGFSPHYSARTADEPIPEGEEVIVLDPGGGNVLTVAPLGGLGDDEIDRALAREAASRESERGTDRATETEKSG